MPTGDGSLIDFLGILAVFLLVAANGFFVAAEFSMVAVRRSRVQRLVAKGKRNAKALDRALSQLDANLAACQLGITVSSLGLGWIGEPALARLIEPLLFGLGRFALAGAHVIAVVIAFSIITALHIVLGELMPKSLALQRSERTALAVVRPLWLFRVLLWPAIVVLNGIGNWLLKRCGLKPGTAEEALHSPEELKLLIAASQEGGLLQPAQQQLVERVLSIGNRRITDIMTPRVDLEWIDIEDTPEETLKTIRDCRHEQLLVGKAGIDEPFGMVLKKDLLDQILAGKKLDVMAALRQPIIVPEPMPIFKVLDQFKKAPVRLATILDEYGVLQGIVTQTDLLEAIAGELPEVEGEEPGIVERDDGSLLIDGMMSAPDAFDRLQFRERPEGDFHTVAGFALATLGHLPEVGESFDHEGWRFEIVDLDGRRIDKVLAVPPRAVEREEAEPE
ncbi:MAG TPA: hemolysin family protein [Methyloceanibacter sp.]|jgi:putative hemolysin|nr:hemolysin family protein [Methyloceanibacter sp.]